MSAPGDDPNRSHAMRSTKIFLVPRKRASVRATQEVEMQNAAETAAALAAPDAPTNTSSSSSAATASATEHIPSAAPAHSAASNPSSSPPAPAGVPPSSSRTVHIQRSYDTDPEEEAEEEEEERAQEPEVESLTLPPDQPSSDHPHALPLPPSATTPHNASSRVTASYNAFATPSRPAAGSSTTLGASVVSPGDVVHAFTPNESKAHHRHMSSMGEGQEEGEEEAEAAQRMQAINSFSKRSSRRSSLHRGSLIEVGDGGLARVIHTDPREHNKSHAPIVYPMDMPPPPQQHQHPAVAAVMEQEEPRRSRRSSRRASRRASGRHAREPSSSPDLPHFHAGGTAPLTPQHHLIDMHAATHESMLPSSASNTSRLDTADSGLGSRRTREIQAVEERRGRAHQRDLSRRASRALSQQLPTTPPENLVQPFYHGQESASPSRGGTAVHGGRAGARESGRFTPVMTGSTPNALNTHRPSRLNMPTTPNPLPPLIPLPSSSPPPANPLSIIQPGDTPPSFIAMHQQASARSLPFGRLRWGLGLALGLSVAIFGIIYLFVADGGGYTPLNPKGELFMLLMLLVLLVGMLILLGCLVLIWRSHTPFTSWVGASLQLGVAMSLLGCAGLIQDQDREYMLSIPGDTPLLLGLQCVFLGLVINFLVFVGWVYYAPKRNTASILIMLNQVENSALIRDIRTVKGMNADLAQQYALPVEQRRMAAALATAMGLDPTRPCSGVLGLVDASRPVSHSRHTSAMDGAMASGGGGGGLVPPPAAALMLAGDQSAHQHRRNNSSSIQVTSGSLEKETHARERDRERERGDKERRRRKTRRAARSRASGVLPPAGPPSSGGSGSDAGSLDFPVLSGGRPNRQTADGLAMKQMMASNLELQKKLAELEDQTANMHSVAALVMQNQQKRLAAAQQAHDELASARVADMAVMQQRAEFLQPTAQ